MLEEVSMKDFESNHVPEEVDATAEQTDFSFRVAIRMLYLERLINGRFWVIGQQQYIIHLA